MKLIFAGTPANAARTLQFLLASQHEVVAVLTRPDAPVGRKRIMTPSPVAAVADAAGLRVFKADQVSEELAGELAGLGADLGVIVAYGALLKRYALDALPLGWVNLHYSLLPDWRGAAPVQNALIAGDAATGVTLFQLDEGMDTGPIFGVVHTPINAGETAGRLLERLTELGCSLLSQELPRIEAGVAVGVAQLDEPGTVARLAAKPTREWARIDWSLPATEIERLVLGMNPEPMAWSLVGVGAGVSAGEDSLRVLDAASLGKTDWSALACESESTHQPGVLQFEPKRVLVQCGGGTLLQLKTVQPAGKKPMPALDWARGAAGKVTTLG